MAHFTRAFHGWNDYREGHLYQLEQTPWENAKCLGLDFWTKDSDDLRTVNLACYDTNSVLPGGTEEEKITATLKVINKLEEEQGNVNNKLLIYVIDENYLLNKCYLWFKNTMQQLPTQLPFFSNHRPLSSEAVFNLLISFQEFIMKKNLTFTLMEVVKGLCKVTSTPFKIIIADRQVIIDGSHRFVALMIFKGITPYNYSNKITKEGELENYYQIHIPPIIHPYNLNIIASKANMGNKSVFKESLADEVRLFFLSITNVSVVERILSLLAH